MYQFSSTFNGDEFFLADHQLDGKRILPGVAHVEMALAAMLASGLVDGTVANVCLNNVVWVRPLVVGDAPEQVHIGLYPEDNGDIGYEIYGDASGEDGDAVVYSQGMAVL